MSVENASSVKSIPLSAQDIHIHTHTTENYTTEIYDTVMDYVIH